MCFQKLGRKSKNLEEIQKTFEKTSGNPVKILIDN